MCPFGYNHNGFVATRAHDVRLLIVRINKSKKDVHNLRLEQNIIISHK